MRKLYPQFLQFETKWKIWDMIKQWSLRIFKKFCLNLQAQPVNRLDAGHINYIYYPVLTILSTSNDNFRS